MAKKKTKKIVEEVEILEEVDGREEVREKIATIQEQIITLNNEADEITSTALSNARTSDLTEYQETLVSAIMAIQEATGENLQEEGMISSFWSKITSNFGFAKKLQKSAKESFIENASLQENIDRIFDSLEGSIQATEQDLHVLSKLQHSLARSVDYGTKLIAEIEEIYSMLGDSDEDLMEKGKLDGLLRELKSINLVNSNTANQIRAQITTTSGLAQNLREVRPILKNLIKSQTLVALQNARMAQSREVRDLVSNVVNDFVTKNNAKTNEVILDAIEYSGKTVIEKETIEELGTQHSTFIKELNHIVSDLNRQKLEYNRTVDKVTAQLGEGLSTLPKLMSGVTDKKAISERKIKREKKSV